MTIRQRIFHTLGVIAAAILLIIGAGLLIGNVIYPLVIQPVMNSVQLPAINPGNIGLSGTTRINVYRDGNLVLSIDDNGTGNSVRVTPHSGVSLNMGASTVSSAMDLTTGSTINVLDGGSRVISFELTNSELRVNALSEGYTLIAVKRSPFSAVFGTSADSTLVTQRSASASGLETIVLSLDPRGINLVEVNR